MPIMKVKCTKCHHDHSISKYMKNGKQLKTCIKCRRKNKVYRNGVTKKWYTKFAQCQHNMNRFNNMDKLNKLPVNPITNNLKLIFNLIVTKYTDNLLSVKVDYFTDEAILQITCLSHVKDFENINFTLLLSVYETTKWKMVNKRITTLIEGVTKECPICINKSEILMCCESCHVSYCDECFFKIYQGNDNNNKCAFCRMPMMDSEQSITSYV